MKLDIFKDQSKKGLGTTDTFDVIVVGRKGETKRVALRNGGSLTLDWGDNVRDIEIKVAIVLLSHTIQTIGKEKVNELLEGKGLKEINKDGQMIYEKSIQVDAKDISALIYNGDRTKGKRIYTALKHLENLRMNYEMIGQKSTVLRYFARPAYGNGTLTFDVSNFLINRLASTLVAFRMKPVLEHQGLTMRLSMYVETHQRSNGKYKDSDGSIRTKYVPMNEYSLETLTTALALEYKQESKIISELSESFKELNNSNNNFPKYSYEKRRKTFESEYKNGVKSRLIN